MTHRQALADVPDPFDPFAGTLASLEGMPLYKAAEKLAEIANLTESSSCGESWLPVVDWPEYEVSSKGRVRRVASYRSTFAGRVLKLKSQYSYFRVGLCRECKVHWFFVHRLVATAFLPSHLPEQTQVAHNNGIGTDNRVENLRWDTPTGNASDRWVHGGYETAEGHACARLTWKLAEEIRNMKTSGVSAREIIRVTGLGKTTVYAVLRGERWSQPGPRGQADLRAIGAV